MGQVVELIRLLWVSVAAYLGIKGAMIASLNLLGLVIMVSYLLVKDVQDTLLKVGGWLVELLLLRLPALIWPRLRTGPRPTRYLYGDRAIADNVPLVLIILGTYGLVCTLIVAVSAQ